MKSVRMPDRSRAGDRWHWITRVGVLLLVAGVALGGWVGWQLWGTNWESARKHSTLVERAESSWLETRDSSDSVPEGEAELDDAPVVETAYGDLSSIVRIPAFGDDYAVPVLEGTGDEVLAAGYGHFTSSAPAGARGNFALAAHRVTHGEPLREMTSLEVGDEIIVETARWTYTYVLDTPGDGLRVSFTDSWVLAPLPQNPRDGAQPDQVPGQRLITLTTCAELFHTDDRLVAFGHLVDKQSISRGSTT